jgi:UDP-N-acetylenolpyruvoylglucosamine reductase
MHSEEITAVETRIRDLGTTDAELLELGDELEGAIAVPSDERWDAARQAWNLAVRQHPRAVALPESAEDVVAIARFARARGLRVAAQGTGHGAAPLGSLKHTILIKNERMREVSVDPIARTARVEAGVVWQEVVAAAAPHGLAALAGSSADVGVVGYTLGGGLSFLSRKHGLAANKVTAVELVTAEGRLVRADREHEPDLFWAVRGGGGSFGVVTALEFELVPQTHVYAGVLWWPIERAAEVLDAWRRLTELELPDELTTVGRLLQLPPLPHLPEHLRGKSFVLVEAIFLGDPEEGDAWLASLRSLEPVMDTMRVTAMPDLLKLHMDPEQPVPGAADGMLLAELSSEAVSALADLVPGSPLLSVEVRHLGGALARPAAAHGALSCLEAGYSVFAVGPAPTPTFGHRVEQHIEEIQAALAPWEADRTYLNFASRRLEPEAFFTETARRRLRRVKATYDPHDAVRSNQPVDAA